MFTKNRLEIIIDDGKLDETNLSIGYPFRMASFPLNVADLFMLNHAVHINLIGNFSFARGF